MPWALRTILSTQCVQKCTGWGVTGVGDADNRRRARSTAGFTGLGHDVPVFYSWQITVCKSRTWMGRSKLAHNFIHIKCAEVYGGNLDGSGFGVRQFYASKKTCFESMTCQFALTLAHNLIHKICAELWARNGKSSCHRDTGALPEFCPVQKK